MENTGTAQYRKKLGYIEGGVSIAVNVLLAVAKFWVGMISGSVAIVADGWHTLSDTLTSVILVMGFYFSSKKPDSSHPFGHGRAEHITSLLISMMLFWVGVRFLVESAGRIMSGEAARYGKSAVWIMIVAVIVKEALARLSLYLGRKAQSQSLRADGYHHRTDALSSLIILAAILVGRNISWIDGLLGIMVSVMIMYAGWKLLRESVSIIIGEDISQEQKREIIAIAEDFTDEIACVHHIHLHDYGDHKELTLHIRLPSRMELEKAHDIAAGLEDLISSKLGLETTIHLEPVR